MATPVVTAEKPFDGWKGLPNALATIAILGGVLDLIIGLLAAASLPAGAGMAALIMIFGGVLGCLLLYALGAIVAVLRSINHNLQR